MFQRKQNFKVILENVQKMKQVFDEMECEKQPQTSILTSINHFDQTCNTAAKVLLQKHVMFQGNKYKN